MYGIRRRYCISGIIILDMKHIVIDARIRRSTTGRYTDRLIGHLQDIDPVNRYTILVHPDDPWTPKASNFRAVPCPYPQFSLNPLHQLGFARQLYHLKPDLVHFTMTQQPLLYFGRIVTTTHDTTMYSFVRRGMTPFIFYKIKMALYRFLVWWSHRKSQRILVPAETVAKEFAARQPFTKPKLVVTLEASEPPLSVIAKRPEVIGEHESFILYVGTAFPHKNLSVLVEAFNLLQAKHHKLKLVITGNTTEKHAAELITWAKTQPSWPNIIFPGFVSDAELKWLYGHTACYVFTSLSEGFGLPPLEAMAHGAPVASSNLSVMPEIYGDAAHYFDPRNPGDVADKVGDVLDNPILRASLIEKGYSRLERYSWQTMAEETLAVYTDVMHG